MVKSVLKEKLVISLQITTELMFIINLQKNKFVNYSSEGKTRIS